MSAELRTSLELAYRTALGNVYLGAACLTALAFIAALCVPERPLRSREDAANTPAEGPVVSD